MGNSNCLPRDFTFVRPPSSRSSFRAPRKVSFSATRSPVRRKHHYIIERKRLDQDDQAQAIGETPIELDGDIDNHNPPGDKWDNHNEKYCEKRCEYLSSNLPHDYSPTGSTSFYEREDSLSGSGENTVFLHTEVSLFEEVTEKDGKRNVRRANTTFNDSILNSIPPWPSTNPDPTVSPSLEVFMCREGAHRAWPSHRHGISHVITGRRIPGTENVEDVLQQKKRRRV